MKDYFIIGKITGAHGIQGEVKCFPITDDVNRFKKLSQCMLLSNEEKLVREAHVTKCRISGKLSLLTIEGISDRDAADKVSGLFVAVKRDRAAPLPAGRYYIADMIGCQVESDEQGSLGVLSDVLVTGANDVLVVKRSKKPDLLIPYLNAVVLSVDIQTRIISVKLPEGLYEIYEPGADKTQT